ncbi:MAG: hypothetical protein AXA67_12115 [Methylothermaceae bacteria B42]|nr:MAG: hypothetical protein AXA67_12115 [Methylothermaceae bacteria B42]
MKLAQPTQHKGLIRQPNAEILAEFKFRLMKLEIRPRLLVSACLLGQEVRYDGRHKCHLDVIALAKDVDLIPLCPEVAIGLGIPRPPIQLVAGESGIKLLEVNDPNLDHTQKMADFVRSQVGEMASMDGLIAKRNSPSCGLGNVPVYEKNGGLMHHFGQGAFSGSLQRVYPALPVIEEQDLEDAQKRGNFLLRVFTHSRWRDLGGTSLTLEALKDFHQCHRYLLMARSFNAYQRLGKMLQNRKVANLSVNYLQQMMAVLKREENRRNLLEIVHAISQTLASQLNPSTIQAIDQAIESCGEKETAVSSLMTLLRENLACLDFVDPAIELFLHPFPAELMAE